jgi:SAM-dependent methyltransferase
VAVDWKPVLAVAAENGATPAADRHRTVAGDAFKVDFGGGFDVALVSNFLHHFDTATCVALLRKVHAALKPEGRIAVLEFVPNGDRVSPPIPAAFSLTMVAGTPSGDAYTFAELCQQLEDAGFSEVSAHPVRGPTTAVLART